MTRDIGPAPAGDMSIRFAGNGDSGATAPELLAVVSSCHTCCDAGLRSTVAQHWRGAKRSQVPGGTHDVISHFPEANKGTTSLSTTTCAPSIGRPQRGCLVVVTARKTLP